MTCTPDSDSNILDPAVSPDHAGTAFLELQFYPPGWVPWPTWRVAVGASGCDPTKWCAAMNIFSLAGDPVNGTTLNPACAAQVGGLEYVNFAFLTKNGPTTAPPNPVDSTAATFTPDPANDLFMNSGDNPVRGGLQPQRRHLPGGQHRGVRQQHLPDRRGRRFLLPQQRGTADSRQRLHRQQHRLRRPRLPARLAGR